MQVALVGSLLIDGSSRDPVSDATVLIDDRRIVWVGPTRQARLPAGCRSIDVSGTTVMPGLIDTHVHLCFGESDSCVWAGGFFPPLMEHPLTLIGIKGFARARRALQMGFTTLRDTGDVGFLGVAVRDAINSGLVEGPRVFACGPYLNATSGYANPMPPWLVRTDVLPSVADGVEGVIRYVRTQVRMGTDWVKMVATGGGTVAVWDEQQFTDEEMRAFITEAHRKARPVAVHAQQAKGILTAIKLGVDTVEHGTEMVEEGADLMARNGIYLVPTLTCLTMIAENGPEYGISASRVETARSLLGRAIATFKMAREKGVPIALGSDAGWAPAKHGESAVELEMMVKHGMTPMEAIVAATSRAAAALKRADTFGTLSAGMLADLVVVRGNPLDDIRVLQDRNRIAMVMKEGDISVDRMSTSI